MRSTKRIVSMSLALAFIINIFGVTVFAAEGEPLLSPEREPYEYETPVPYIVEPQPQVAIDSPNAYEQTEDIDDFFELGDEDDIVTYEEEPQEDGQGGPSATFDEALSIAMEYDFFSELTQQQKNTLRDGLNIDLSAMEKLEQRGLQIIESVIYGQAAYLSDLSLEEILERCPTNDACADYMEQLQEELRQEDENEGGAVQAAAAVPSTLDDPKQYELAPVGYMNGHEESAALNSGSLNLTITDFVVPGLNGMDVVITRQYSSSRANQQDLDVKFTSNTQTLYDFELRVTARGTGIRDEGTSGNTSINELLYSGGPANANNVKYIAQNIIDYNGYEDEFYNGATWDGWRLSNVKFTTTTKNGRTQNVPSSTIRENTHLKENYGLGYGWGFALPSIEIVPETKQNSRVTYHNYLHLPDGRSFEISGNTLKDYTLKDITIQTVNNQSLSLPYGGTVNYDMLITMKDGEKNYFQAQKSGSQVLRYMLVAQQDRFGNTIRYNFTLNGGVTITDTLGQTISLVKSGNTMTWTLPDGSTIVYTLDSTGQLQQVRDQEGRITTYGYTVQNASVNYYGLRYNDQGVSVPHKHLTTVTHPTGARTTYTYRTARVDGVDDYDFYESYRYFYVLGQRYDTEDSTTVNNTTYNYNVSVTRRKITGAEEANNNSVVRKLTFNNDGYPTQQQVNHAGSLVEQTTYTYNNTYKQLLDQVSTIRYGTSNMTIAQSYTYDDKGNVLTYTDPLNNKTTYTYDATYSLPLTVSYNRQSGMTVKEEYTLRADKAVVEWARVYENNVVKSVMQYQYDQYNNISEQRRYYGSLTVLGAYESILYSYANSNSSLPAAYNGLFMTQTQILGVKDADGNLIESPNGAGVVQMDYVYDRMGNVLSVKGPAHADDITTYTYDKLNRVLTQTNPDDTQQRRMYNNTQNTLTITDENDTQMRFQYTQYGNIKEVYDVTGGNTLLTGYKYDTRRRPIEEYTYGASGLQSTLIMAYDRYDRLTSRTLRDNGNAVMYQETYAYNNALNANHSKITTTIVGDTNAPNVVTTVYNDKLGRTVQEGYMLNGTEQISYYTYDNRDNVLTYQSALDRSRSVTTAKYEYNHMGQVTQKTNALGQVITYEYDELGNLASVTDVAGGKATIPYATLYTYDALGQMLTQSVPFEMRMGSVVYSTTRYDYNPAGSILSQQMSNHTPGEAESYSRIEYEYNPRGWLLQTQMQGDGDTLVTTYEYDNVGNPVAVTTGDNRVEMTYDHRGDLTTRTDALGQVEYFNYDAVGRLTSKQDRNGNITDYSYDSMGRLTLKQVQDVQGEQTAYTSYSFTKTNQSLSVANDELSIQYRYDALGRLTTETESNGVSKSYVYDIGGNPTSFSISKGGTIQSLSYGYDNLNRLTSVKQGNETVGAYTYDDNGNRSSLTYANGVTTDYAYNLANLVTKLKNQSGGSVLSSYTYGYQLDGNQIHKSDHNGNTTTYQYDGMGRLTEENTDDATIQYTFDAQSNRDTMSVSGDEAYTVQYRYDENNRLLLEEKDSGSALELTYYTYDPNGNQVMKEREIFSEPGTVDPAAELVQGIAYLEMMEYNGYNQLTSAYVDGKEAVYSYRPDGMRHQKTVDGIATTHLWNGSYIVADLDVDGVVQASYVRGTGLLHNDASDGRQTYLFNAHGDVVQLADGIGGILKEYDYDAFGVQKGLDGEVEEDEPVDTNPFRYAGEYHDLETGTIYLRARYYNPKTGRFTQQDSQYSLKYELPNGHVVDDALSLNLYTYGHNNPIKYKDPSGNASIAIDIGKKIGKEIGMDILRTLLEYGPKVGLQIVFDTYKDLSLSDVISVVNDALTNEVVSCQVLSWSELVELQGISWSEVVDHDSAMDTWNDWGELDRHYEDHAKEFDDVEDYEDYVRKAHDFYRKRDGHEVKVDEETGDIRVYDPNTNTFGSYTAEGKTRTFFKPRDRGDYWASQPGTLQ